MSSGDSEPLITKAHASVDRNALEATRALPQVASVHFKTLRPWRRNMSLECALEFGLDRLPLMFRDN